MEKRPTNTATDTMIDGTRHEDPPVCCDGALLCVHDVRAKQILDTRRHGGTLVQKALSPVPVNQTGPLYRRERRGDFPSVVTLLDQNTRAFIFTILSS